MTLDEMADSVETAKDFGRFVEALAADLLERPEEWENTSLLAFLDALVEYMKSTDQIYENFKRHAQMLPLGDRDEFTRWHARMKPPLQPSWSMFADCLLAAKVYE